MAEELRQAQVHLYPGHPDDPTAFTLPLGAAPERLEAMLA